jgi:hypothetical protein
VKNGEFEAWPTRTRVGPIQDVDWSACPREREYEARRVFVDYAWGRQREYLDAVKTLITADPEQAQARFSDETVSCCVCNRALADPESVGYGIGPECRRWMPGEARARIADYTSRLRGKKDAA